MPWQFQVHFAWWRAAIDNFYGYSLWQYLRLYSLPDQHAEDMKDMIGCYCMGNEL